MPILTTRTSRRPWILPPHGAATMKLGSRVGQGAFAGLSGGIGVALFFLVGDLIQLTPLSTPMALGTTFLGPGGTSIDFPVVAQALTLASAGVRLVAVTAAHLAAFAALGIVAVLLFDAFGWSLGVGGGALFGLIVCSIVFYAGLAFAGSGVVSALPGVWAVLAGNVVAGGLIGGQVKLLRGSR